jgi:2-C-methyl-D-erythritol 4-phosphate cytidylyltransferase
MGGIKKEFQNLDASSSRTVLGEAVFAFSKVSYIDTIVIAVSENEEAHARKALPQEILVSQKPKLMFVNGGNSRRVSVFNALSFLSHQCDAHHPPSYVLIHDGARPWVSSLLIKKLIAEVKKHNAVIPLLPMTDTPKEINNTGIAVFVNNHLKRAKVGLAQTPQAFKFPEIFYAHQKAADVTDEEFTDDAEIWDRFYGKVTVIPGDPKNKKITFAEDLK